VVINSLTGCNQLPGFSGCFCKFEILGCFSCLWQDFSGFIEIKNRVAEVLLGLAVAEEFLEFLAFFALNPLLASIQYGSVSSPSL
jgi:hypothetical protein